MKQVTVTIHSVADGELPTENGVRVIGLHQYRDGAISVLTLPRLWWNARKKCFMWCDTPEIGEVAFWFYESDLHA